MRENEIEKETEKRKKCYTLRDIYAVRGKKREREREVIKGFCEEITSLKFCKKKQSSITHKGYIVKRSHQGLPSVSIKSK